MRSTVLQLACIGLGLVWLVDGDRAAAMSFIAAAIVIGALRGQVR